MSEKTFKDIEQEATTLIENIAFKVNELDKTLTYLSNTLLTVKEKLNLTDEEYKSVVLAIITMLKKQI